MIYVAILTSSAINAKNVFVTFQVYPTSYVLQVNPMISILLTYLTYCAIYAKNAFLTFYAKTVICVF